MKTLRTLSLMFLFLSSIHAWADTSSASPAQKFDLAIQSAWKETFFDGGTSAWQEQWFLDGAFASITHSANGMDFFAGPENLNHAHHAVLWTKQSFRGDIKIEYDYTKLDDTIEAVNILYLLATGKDSDGFSKDIYQWRDLRKEPYMKFYFNNMATYHISYAAFETVNTDPKKDYIRARRYMPNINSGALGNTDLKPDYEKTGLFKKGELHRVVVIKKGRDLFMQITGAEKTMLCHWDASTLPNINEGRVGLRHMYTRGARYANFKISIAQ